MMAQAALRTAEYASSQLEAEAALLEVQTLITIADLYNEEAAETILNIFQVVNGYVVRTDIEPEKMGDEAINAHEDSQPDAGRALYEVKRRIVIAELYSEEATKLILRIFQVVNDYVVKMESETETICDEAMDVNDLFESSSYIEPPAVRAPGTCFAVEGQ